MSERGWHATWVEAHGVYQRGACQCGWRGVLKRSQKAAASDAIEHYDASRAAQSSGATKGSESVGRGGSS